jgi:mycofactocin precursor
MPDDMPLADETEAARHDSPRAPLTAETAVAGAAPDRLVERDLLVEDVSIDGMCGVY